MNSLESAKLEKIGRQAMNIQMWEAEFKNADSDGNPIDGTEHLKMFLYNLEKISAKEMEKALLDGSYEFDTRIMEVDPERARNIFPHAGESKKDFGPVYWEHVKGNITKCRCSACGMQVNVDEAVERSFTNLDEYKSVKYRFCPKCGSVMSIRKENDNG